MKNMKGSSTFWFVTVIAGAALVLLTGLSPVAVAQSVTNLNNNTPPFDFNDDFYAENGINVGQLNGSPSVQRFGFSPEGVPIRQIGAPAFLPGQVNWKLDPSNTDPDRNNIRILATTGGYKDDTGSPTQFISIIAFLNDQTLFNEENRNGPPPPA